ncbi:TRAF-like family protein [Corchorus olitorius]|uniref:TRAF-like family protein n=1 Tax=Corchorus olitorius TaxID=93759 RepID=A0A1R3KQ20_9ROSI|nr:TRAF-like family protein [Corchorus olitorius]
MKKSCSHCKSESEQDYFCHTGPADEGGESTRRFEETKSEWGLAQLLSIETFEDVSNGYLVDDCCILGAEVFVSKHAGRVECVSFINKPDDNIYTWEIEKFSTLNAYYYDSEHFIVQGRTWKIRIFPKGYNTLQAKGGLSVYLHWVHNNNNGGSASDEKVYAEYKFRVKNQKLDKSLQEYTGKAWFSCGPLDNWGLHEFISRDNLKDSSKAFVVEDRLILEAEIVVTSTTKSLP